MFLPVITLCLFASTTDALSKHPILIVVSYDAFRYNFINPINTPNIFKLRDESSWSNFLFNVFPTKTFPNHHSIATGLYPEVHGVVGNSYYDPRSDEVKKMGPEMYDYNAKIVPIWRRNEDMGDERYSGVMMWPGGIYPYQNKNVTYVQAFDAKYDFFKRVDTVISWIKNPDKPANLVMLYIEEPDTHGHAYGPNSQVVKDLIVKLDNLTQYLEDQLVKNDLKSKVNVIHLSDHGMSHVPYKNFINVTGYLEPDTYKMAGTSPVLQIFPEKNQEDNVYNRLMTAYKDDGGKHFRVLKKDEYLERWHYKNNPRAPPILLLAKVGYAFDDMILAANYYAKEYHFELTPDTEFGVHGYDYMENDMHAFFMARGPKIKKNQKISPPYVIDLYNLFCQILEIAPLDNNGTLANISGIITDNSDFTLFPIIIFTVGGILIFLLLIISVTIIVLIMIKRQQSITTNAALNKRFPQTFQSSIEAQHLLESDEA